MEVQELPDVAEALEVVVEETAAELALTTNVYAEIKRRLIAAGIPPEEIAFIHDADTPAKKAALFDAVNSGKIRIMLGSTEKMGTGMNAQQRLIATHHLTPPWRPADLEQRVGRMLRQGNIYPEVFEFAYVVPGSFDGYSWQLLEAKAGFICQFRNGLVGRESEDITDEVISFAELKALASGNPLILQKVEMDAQLGKLDAIRQDWLNARSEMGRKQALNEREAADLKELIAVLEKAIETRDSHGGPFSITIGGRAFSKREDAGAAMRKAVAGIMTDSDVQFGAYRGLPLVGRLARRPMSLEAEAITGLHIGTSLYLFHVADSDLGAVASLDARLRSLDADLAKKRQELEQASINIASLCKELERPWEQEAAYVELVQQVTEINARLRLDEEKAASEETPDAFVPDEDNAWREIYEIALLRIESLHADPAVLARFKIDEAPMAITPDFLEDLKAEIASKEALLQFGQVLLAALPENETVQLDLFGGFAPPEVPKRRSPARRT